MDHLVSQAEFIRGFNDRNREKFNPALIKRDDQVAVDSIRKIAYSCERDRYYTLKVLETREIWDYEEIYDTLREYEEKKRKPNSSVENPYDRIKIRDSDFMLLVIKYFVRHNGKERQEIINPETKKKETIIVTNPWEVLDVLIAIPTFQRKYYYRLNGNYYSACFQIVDGSTYNNMNIGGGSKKADCNTFKTMFTPIRVFRMYKDLVDFYSKSTIRNTIYTSIVFDTHVNLMDYILANFGLYGACAFLEIQCIQINDQPIVDDRWYNFQRHNIFISYPKECASDSMIPSLAVTIYDVIKKDTRVDDLFDIRFWLKHLGKCFRNDSVDKGLFVLDSIDGTLDLITQETLRLPDEEKQDIYHIFRWLMREFLYLKNKDNVDITIKRIRYPGDYIAHIYAMKMTDGLRRASDMGKRVTLHSVIKYINTQPMYLINQIINMDNLIDYRDFVNDNDGCTVTRGTYKGISGLGENGAAVQKLYKYVDPTHAGIMDLDASTESDPGMSGLICPMAKLYDHNYFSDYQEPNYWREQFKPLQKNFIYGNKNIKQGITFDHEVTPSYMELREKVIQESLDLDKVKCPIYSLDGSVDYSTYAALLEREEEENKERQSLFTIIQDDDVDDEEEYYG